MLLLLMLLLTCVCLLDAEHTLVTGIEYEFTPPRAAALPLFCALYVYFGPSRRVMVAVAI